MRVLLLLPVLLACYAYPSNEPQQGAGGTASGSDNQVFNLILTPGQTAEIKVEAQENDVILATVSSQAFDPAIGLYTSSGEKLRENDDIKEGDQSGQIIYRIKEAGDYKLVVSGFKGAAGGPFAMSLRRFNAPPLVGTTTSADFRENGADWRAIQIKKDTPTVIGIQGSRSQLPSGYDSAGNNLAQVDAHTFPSGGRFTITSPIDQEIYIYIPRTGYKNFTIDALPVKFETISLNSPISGELARSQAIAYRFRAKAGDILRTQIGPGRTGFEVIFRAVKLDDPKASADIEDLIGLSKTSNIGTHFIRQSGEYEAVIAQSTFRPVAFKLSISEYIQKWEKDTFQSTLPIGENIYYKWEMPLGVLLDLSAESNLFDLNMTLMSSEGNPIANLDDDGESRDPKYQMLITRPGAYYLRIGSVGNGGGGTFKLTRKITLPTSYQSGKTIEVVKEKPELRLIPCTTGKFFYLSVNREKAANIALYRPDGRQIGFSEIQEPNGRSIIMINPDMDGDFLMVITTNEEKSKVTISNARVGDQN